MTIQAENLLYTELNRQIKSSHSDVVIKGCMGQRFIGSGESRNNITIHGTPGNALGAYLDGSTITVHGNAQDAVGDTMNDGRIVIHGSVGDALGYAMRGGKIFVRGNAGYRTGIHMKQYKDKKPVIIVGGSVGSFLGEYLAGGVLIVLGLEQSDSITGAFTGTGMHGGKIFLRCDQQPTGLPSQVTVSKATPEDLDEISSDIREFCHVFSLKADDILNSSFYVLLPNAKSPYKQLYVAN